MGQWPVRNCKSTRPNHRPQNHHIQSRWGSEQSAPSPRAFAAGRRCATGRRLSARACVRCSLCFTQPAPVPIAASFRPWSLSSLFVAATSIASGPGGKISIASKPSCCAVFAARGRSSQNTNGPPRASGTRLTVTLEKGIFSSKLGTRVVSYTNIPATHAVMLRRPRLIRVTRKDSSR